jgi:hypothetical protein
MMFVMASNLPEDLRGVYSEIPEGFADAQSDGCH